METESDKCDETRQIDRSKHDRASSPIGPQGYESNGGEKDSRDACDIECMDEDIVRVNRSPRATRADNIFRYPSASAQ